MTTHLPTRQSPTKSGQARSFWLTIVALTLSLLLPVRTGAHPGSGIAVDRQGNIYFVDTGGGVLKIDRSGRLSRHQGPAYHWMAIDLDGTLKNVTMPFTRLSR